MTKEEFNAEVERRIKATPQEVLLDEAYPDCRRPGGLPWNR